MNYSELLQLAKGWGNFKFYRSIIGRLHTFNQGLQKRLKNFAERYPECCYLSNSTKEGSETYIIQKGRLSLNLRPPYAKERIQKALETIQIAREEKLDDS